MQDTAHPATEHRSVDAAQGVAWWTESWTLFTKNPGMWILYGLTFLVCSIVVSLIPLLGGLIGALLTPVIVGGWMLAARKLEEGGTLKFEDLFAGFGPNLSSLIVLGAAALVFQLVVVLVAGGIGVGAMIGMMSGAAANSGAGMAAGFGVGMLAILIAVLLGFVLSMLLWFAPALVVFDGVPPIDAMKASLAACLGNIVPFLLFGLVGFVLTIVACIPLGLGMLVVGPMYGLAAYLSYRGIFGR